MNNRSKSVVVGLLSITIVGASLVVKGYRVPPQSTSGKNINVKEAVLQAALTPTSIQTNQSINDSIQVSSGNDDTKRRPCVSNCGETAPVDTPIPSTLTPVDSPIAINTPSPTANQPAQADTPSPTPTPDEFDSLDDSLNQLDTSDQDDLLDL